MKLSLGEIADLLDGVGSYDPQAVARGYSIDTRTISPGELFFAIRGERLDGQDFVQAALEKGAIAAVVESDRAADVPAGVPVISVENTMTALQALGAAVRKLWAKPVVGVTGSAGKTTTKELVAAVLGTRFGVLKSQGNLNNHFGMPLQLLKLEPEHDIAVIEMGMSRPREITRLAELAQPDTGVVTCVAPVHIEFFKSVAEIAKAKKELIDSLPPDGVAVLNADDEYVSQFGRDFPGRVVTFGVNVPADIRAENVQQRGTSGSQFDIVTMAGRVSVELPLIGTHNVYNALAAVATGWVYGADLADMAAALANVSASDKRGEVLQIGGATVINDCYNSNPKALQSMIDALVGMPAKGRRIVVAGEMLELGTTAEDLHRRCGQHAARAGIDIVVGVRGAARFVVMGFTERVNYSTDKGRGEFVKTPEEAGEWLAREVRPGDVVLLKASRGVKLESALEVWRSRRPELTAR